MSLAEIQNLKTLREQEWPVTSYHPISCSKEKRRFIRMHENRFLHSALRPSSMPNDTVLATT